MCKCILMIKLCWKWWNLRKINKGKFGHVGKWREEIAAEKWMNLAEISYCVNSSCFWSHGRMAWWGGEPCGWCAHGKQAGAGRVRAGWTACAHGKQAARGQQAPGARGTCGLSGRAPSFSILGTVQWTVPRKKKLKLKF